MHCAVEENVMKDSVKVARVFPVKGQEKIVQGVKVMPPDAPLNGW